MVLAISTGEFRNALSKELSDKRRTAGSSSAHAFEMAGTHVANGIFAVLFGELTIRLSPVKAAIRDAADG
jgi:hypothetical protein